MRHEDDEKGGSMLQHQKSPSAGQPGVIRPVMSPVGGNVNSLSTFLPLSPEFRALLKMPQGPCHFLICRDSTRSHDRRGFQCGSMCNES